jgi:hypothetical protein
MNGCGQSDGPVVPANLPDKAAAAEAGEERGPAKGNADSETRPGHSAGSGVSSELDRVRQVAFGAILGAVRDQLALPSGCELAAGFHSMLVYEPGQFFVAHQRVEARPVSPAPSRVAPMHRANCMPAARTVWRSPALSAPPAIVAVALMSRG